MAKRSLKIALIFAIFAVLAQGLLGDLHARQVAQTQPAKLAAFEGMWEARTNAPLNLFGIPIPSQEKTSLSIGIPGMLSWLVHGDTSAKVQGLQDFKPSDRPPVLATYWSYRVMLFLAGWFVLLVLWGGYLMLKGRLYSNKSFLKAALYSITLPVIANEFGWFAAEIGRQPWIVQGLLRTSNAVSPLPAYQVLLTIILFLAIYSCLLVLFIYLIRREIKKPLAEDSGFVFPAAQVSPSMKLHQ